MKRDWKLTRRQKLYLALAHALVECPGASLERLAEAAGTSRRTLYRVASSREELIAQLQDYAVEVLSDVISQADWDNPSVEEVIGFLANGFLRYSELCLYLTYSGYGKNEGEKGGYGVALTSYRATMESFFLKCQNEGKLRRDLSPTWLFYSFDFLLLGASAGKLNGALPTDTAPQMVVTSFLAGARPTPEND